MGEKDGGGVALPFKGQARGAETLPRSRDVGAGGSGVRLDRRVSGEDGWGWEGTDERAPAASDRERESGARQRLPGSAGPRPKRRGAGRKWWAGRELG
jgi:hypothetical protein